MNKNKLWMVRAGEGAYLIEEFLNKSIIAIGWKSIGDMSIIDKIDKIKELVIKNYPDDKTGSVNMSAGQIYRFIKEFKIGDAAMTYNPSERVYWIGEITSDYKYNEEICEYPNIRNIKWINKIQRDKLSISTKSSLGGLMTLFEISNPARDEIFNLLDNSDKPFVKIENEKEKLEEIKDDFIAQSFEFIKDKILSLDWEEMQELVAGILRAMGYKTRISPKGADRGKDIIASPDGLGLEEPKIMVEVKHRQGQMGSQELRSFLGGLRDRNKGLYVSTGGFSKDARYEAERSNNPCTLIDSDMLVELISQNYDSFDSETKSLVPLKKIYWPM